MAYDVDLTGAWAKVGRAKSHTEGLSSYIAEHLGRAWATDPATGAESKGLPLFATFDAEAGYYSVCFAGEPVADFATTVALMLGDAVHNVRAALDHAVWQLALRNSGGVDPSDKEAKNIQFPIVAPGPNDRNAFKSSKVQLHLLSDDFAFLERYQPYMPLGPDRWLGPQPAVHPLALLNRLDNHDKHRVLTPTFPLQSGFALHGVLPAGNYEMLGITVAEAGAEVMRMHPAEPGDYADVPVVGTATALVELPGLGRATTHVDRIIRFVIGLLRELEEFVASGQAPGQPPGTILRPTGDD